MEALIQLHRVVILNAAVGGGKRVVAMKNAAGIVAETLRIELYSGAAAMLSVALAAAATKSKMRELANTFNAKATELLLSAKKRAGSGRAAVADVDERLFSSPLELTTTTFRNEFKLIPSRYMWIIAGY